MPPVQLPDALKTTYGFIFFICAYSIGLPNLTGTVSSTCAVEWDDILRVIELFILRHYLRCVTIKETKKKFVPEHSVGTFCSKYTVGLRSWPHSSTCSAINYILSVLSFDYKYPDLLMASLNRP